jgi:hypothetical protein
LRPVDVPDTSYVRSSRWRGYPPALAMVFTLGLLAAGCSGGARSAPGSAGAQRGAASSGVRLSITPAGGAGAAPNRGITVRAVGGRITTVIVHTGGEPVGGTLNAAGTVWHSTWALDVSRRYTVTGSPRAGTWDNGWTMWFLPWRQWLRGGALHEAVLAGPRGSRTVGTASSAPRRVRRHPPRPPARWGAPLDQYLA